VRGSAPLPDHGLAYGARVQAVVDWWFRDRSTGAIVIGQLPNATIGV